MKKYFSITLRLGDNQYWGGLIMDFLGDVTKGQMNFRVIGLVSDYLENRRNPEQIVLFGNSVTSMHSITPEHLDLSYFFREISYNCHLNIRGINFSEFSLCDVGTNIQLSDHHCDCKLIISGGGNRSDGSRHNDDIEKLEKNINSYIERHLNWSNSLSEFFKDF